jgi:hypothetical protein
MPLILIPDPVQLDCPVLDFHIHLDRVKIADLERHQHRLHLSLFRLGNGRVRTFLANIFYSRDQRDSRCAADGG